MRDVVGDLGYEDLGLDAGYGCHAATDHFGARFELTLFRQVIFRQVELQRDQHTEHLFLVDLHSASDGVAVRGRVQAGRCDEILSTEQQAGTLRAAESLAAGERHEVETHLRVLPQVVDGRYVGGGVVQRRNAMFLSEPGELFVADPPFRVVVVVEEHHRGLVVDRALQVFSCLDFHEPHTAVADGMVVTEAMGFLNDRLALHVGEVGEIDDLLPIRAGEDGCCSEGQGRGGPRRHHRGFTMQQRGDALSNLVVKLVEHHVMSGRIGDGLHHFRRHERRGHGRVGPSRIDEGTHAELAKIVAAGASGRNRRGGHRRGFDDASHERQSRDDFKKTSSTPHL